MHYLITGHTGFKGAWLTLLLGARGHRVSGLSLDPVPDSLYELAGNASALVSNLRVDIRDRDATVAAVAAVAPDVVIHLAAQALVRRSYIDPRETMETNVIGTMNVLEAVSLQPTVRAHVVATTDKVYRNVEQEKGYVESDPLGGVDPYSASKAMADLLTQSWVASFPGTPTGIVRAGNVIGGGDVSADRLLPDLINAYAEDRPPALRYPNSVRPWQHVLDCLNGYLTLADALLAGNGDGAWNFGPGRESFVDVGTVSDLVAAQWGSDLHWLRDDGDHPHEAGLLSLDAAKAETQLGWSNRLGFREAIAWTVEWARATRNGEDPRAVTLRQIAEFERS
jgi:CDP-glucose 4,6-dehydratase